MQTSAQTTPRAETGWVEVRSSRGRLLCRLDVGRLLLEVKPKGGAVELVDLRPLLGNYELRITNYELGEESVQLVD